MTYLLDTSIVSYLMRESPEVGLRLAAAARSNTVITCPFVIGEIRYGLGRLAPGRRRSELEQKAEEVLTSLQCPDIPAGVGDHYSAIRLERESAGQTLADNDLWIASAALALDAVLVSSDSDYCAISGLHVEDWTRPVS